MARRALPFGRMVLVRTPSAHGRLRTAARGHTILAQVFMVLPPSPIEPWDKKSGSNRQRRLLSRWSRFGGRVCAQLAGRRACEMSSTAEQLSPEPFSCGRKGWAWYCGIGVGPAPQRCIGLASNGYGWGTVGRAR